jgi:hypothetical protein
MDSGEPPAKAANAFIGAWTLRIAIVLSMPLDQFRTDIELQ